MIDIIKKINIINTIKGIGVLLFMIGIVACYIYLSITYTKIMFVIISLIIILIFGALIGHSIWGEK
jgi:hypothetical protein